MTVEPQGVITRRWAERAQNLELGQLEHARKRAEQWRNGLTSLTALFAVVTIIKGPDAASKVSEGAREDVVGMLTAAFILMALGTLGAMFCSFGWQNKARDLTAETLRNAERSAVRWIRILLPISVALFLWGLVFVGVSTRVLLLDQGTATPTLKLSIKVADGSEPPGVDAGEAFCVEVVAPYGDEGLVVDVEGDSTGEKITLALDEVVRIEPHGDCD